MRNAGPPLGDQEKVVKSLDKKVAQIDHIIEKTKESIEEYKKYKQSLITETVTKGLNPDVEMKDSGIEWIGEIPKHWNVVKIKHTSWIKGRIGWQGLRSSEFIETGPYLITGTDFNNGEINWDTCAHITDERYNEAPEIHVIENDLLVTKDGTIGKVAIAKNCPRKVSLNSGVFLVRNTKKIKCKNKYLYYVILSEVFWRWFNSNLTGNSTILHLYQEQFYNFLYVLPDIEEQQRIIVYLDYKCQQVDGIIKEKEQLIIELESYKKSLIYEYVTGKKQAV
jgi:type I restriction enzyme S subunit